MPALDLRTMEELCQPTMNGRGGPIAPVNIQATDFGLKNHMIQQSMKQNGITDDALRLYLFPYSLTHHATAWFDRLLKNVIHTSPEMASKFLLKYFPPFMVTKLSNDISNFRQLPDESLFEAWERYKLSIDRCPNHNMLPVTQIDTFYNELTLRHRDTINAAAWGGGAFMKKRPEECYDLIENMTAHHNDWDTSAQRGKSSSSITSSSLEIAALTQQMADMRKDMLQMYRINQQVNSVSPSYETCSGPHAYYECQAVGGYTQDIYATSRTYNPGGNTYQTQDLKKILLQRPNGALPSNTEPNPREQVNSITTRIGLTIAEPSIPPHIPYPSRLNKTKLLDKTDVQISKFLKILKQIHFDISLMDALTQIPKFTKVLKDLLKDKDKLEELANTPINVECSAILLNKVTEKLEDPGKFLIPCILQDLEVYNSLVDSGASINLMPLSIYEKLRVRPLKPTRMTLELANRSVTFPMGIAKDVIIKVEKFNFLVDFVIVDFEADPRVPIILGRPFLRTTRALVDLYEEKLTLRVKTSDSLLEEFADELC
ncbi:reverse transcriptase domain-containing protein [Tanacetum coccineum]